MNGRELGLFVALVKFNPFTVKLFWNCWE